MKVDDFAVVLDVPEMIPVCLLSLSPLEGFPEPLTSFQL